MGKTVQPIKIKSALKPGCQAGKYLHVRVFHFQVQPKCFNWSFHSRWLSDLAYECQQRWSCPCFDTDLTAFIMQVKLLLR